MTDKIKIIQDISLLYELSLSVGSSLDPQEDCHRFLRTLISRKSLNFGSVWLNRVGAGGAAFCDLFYIHPNFREGKTSVAFSHFILQALATKPYLSISSQDPHFGAVMHEKKVGKGSYAIFKLGDLGFLKLFASNRPTGFDEMELAQLKQVVDKLKISLDGCFAHIQLKEETENRLVAAKKIEQSRVRMETLIANLQAGILLEDSERKIALVNQAFCDIFGIPVQPELLVNTDCSKAAEHSKHLFKDPEGFSNSIDEVLKNRVLLKSEVLFMVNGKVLERDYVPLFSGDEYQGHLWQYRDITERQNAQQAIQESEEKYRGVLENMELGLLEVDLEENILRTNNAFCQTLGYRTEELIGHKTEKFLTEVSKKTIAARLEELKKGQPGVYELQVKRKDGTLIWLLVSGAPLKNPQGQTIGSIGIQFDLTERKKLEQELAEATMSADRARLAERQFITHMSHEIRTPINALIGMTHLLYETQPNETQKEYLNGLRFSADSLLGIVDNILDLSKIDAGEIEFEQKPFDLDYLLK